MVFYYFCDFLKKKKLMSDSVIAHQRCQHIIYWTVLILLVLNNKTVKDFQFSTNQKPGWSS